MSRKPLRYFLFSKQKRPLYRDGSGHVLEGDGGFYTKAGGQPAHLQDDPQGFSETMIRYARNDRYDGLFRSFTLPLRFVGDGARILRERMWSGGAETVCYLGIQRLDPTQLPYQYRPDYLSELNFLKYHEDGPEVTIEALEGGPSKYLKAYENTTYDILIESDAQSLRLDGLTLKQKVNYLVPEVEFASPSPRNFVLPLSMMGADSVSGADVLYATQNFQALPDGNATTDAQGWLRDSPNWFFKTEAARTIHIQGSVTTQQGSDIVGINIYGTVGKKYYYTTPLQGEGTFTASIDITIQVPAGETLYLFLTHPFTRTITIKETTLTIDFDYRYRTTHTVGYYLGQVLEKLVRKMTGGLYGARSEWLAAKKDIILTTGDAVRGLTRPVIKISLADLFQILNFWSVGLGVEGDTVVVEPLAYFYRSDVMLDLGEVSAAKIDVAEEKFFSTIKPGYDKDNLQDANGRYAFCQPQQWTVPVTRSQKALDLMVPAMADPYAIEILRITTQGRDTTADSGDNQRILFHVRPGAVITSPVSILHRDSGPLSPFDRNILTFPTNAYRDDFTEGGYFTLTGTALNDGTYRVKLIVDGGTSLQVWVEETVQSEQVAMATIDARGHTLYRDPLMTIEGVPDPVGVFNVALRPKNAILNNGARIRSVLDFMDGEQIAFQSAERNAELATTVGGVRVKENENIPVGSLPARLFTPYWLKVKTSAPVNGLDLIRANPYGRVRFTWNGRRWLGYLSDGGVRTADRAEQEWQLLSAPENDLSKFNES